MSTLQMKLLQFLLLNTSYRTAESLNSSTPFAYRQIPTATNYYYKYSFFPKTLVHLNALSTSIVMLPTVAQFSNAVCRVVHVSP